MIHQISDHDSKGDADPIDDEIGDKGCEHHDPTPSAVWGHRNKSLWMSLWTDDLDTKKKQLVIRYLKVFWHDIQLYYGSVTLGAYNSFPRILYFLLLMTLMIIWYSIPRRNNVWVCFNVYMVLHNKVLFSKYLH